MARKKWHISPRLHYARIAPLRFGIPRSLLLLLLLLHPGGKPDDLFLVRDGRQCRCLCRRRPLKADRINMAKVSLVILARTLPTSATPTTAIQRSARCGCGPLHQLA